MTNLVNTPLAKRDCEVEGLNVVVLGLARQGIALVRYLYAQGAHVTVSDHASESQLAAELAEIEQLPVTLSLGGHPDELLDGCDLLFLSGGVPPQIPFVQKAIARGIPLSNDMLLTLQLAYEAELTPVIAVSGSSGKTTTTTLIGEMLNASELNAHVGGNIGTPLVDRMNTVQQGEPLVLEMSSFQLELLDETLTHRSVAGIGPSIACLTNITPNHLDRHASMADYVNAKLNLIQALPENALLVLNQDDPVTASLISNELAEQHRALLAEWKLTELLQNVRKTMARLNVQIAPFSVRTTLEHGAWLDGDTLMLNGAPICKRSDIMLRGEHNISNSMAAALVSQAAGASMEAIRETVTSFAGVPHRLEVVATHNDVVWINDSIATAPERALAALRSFDESDGSIVLLAGGKDKNLPWDEFAEEVIKRVHYLIGFGQSGQMIVDQVQERARYIQGQAPECATVQRLDEAVDLAMRTVQPNSVVLLSPGGTSYDAYRDFEERGRHFAALVAAAINAE